MKVSIIIPVFNEGDRVVKLMDLFQKSIKNDFRVLFCYDLENDNIFEYIDKFKEFNFEIILVKNPLRGPCSAIKEGLNSGNSDCVIVYPADDFINFNLLDKMYEELFYNSENIIFSKHSNFFIIDSFSLTLKYREIDTNINYLYNNPSRYNLINIVNKYKNFFI